MVFEDHFIQYAAERGLSAAGGSMFLETLGEALENTGIVRETEVYDGHDIHAFFSLAARPDAVLHVQVYPGMSTDEEIHVFARIMDRSAMLAIREDSRVSIGNEHGAVIDILPSFDCGVKFPWSISAVQDSVTADLKRLRYIE